MTTAHEDQFAPDPNRVDTSGMIATLRERNAAIEAVLVHLGPAGPEMVETLLAKDDAWEHECAAVMRAQEAVRSRS